MTLVLGIHLGHHASCALAKDGEIVAAAQLERSSRQKYHPMLALDNQLNLELVLKEAGAKIGDVDLIVSCFQSAAPAGVGLGNPLISKGFSLFDPFADNHLVISHHLAHGHSSFDASGFDDTALIVCDYAGSSTPEGADYTSSFRDWYATLTQHAKAPRECKTECLSIYHATRGAAHALLRREYNIAHMSPQAFIYSAAGLYENVSRFVMSATNSHGQMMALAAFGSQYYGSQVDPGALVYVDADNQLQFRNDWQHKYQGPLSFEEKACLASRCQDGTELAALTYARQAKALSGSDNLCVAGGLFLNILSNTRLATSGLFKRFHVPSAPHDAGISIGCAYFGSRTLGRPSKPLQNDRLGPTYSPAQVDSAIGQRDAWLNQRRFTTPQLIDALCDGQVVARASGRAEFGPRALGGRSLLGDPRSASVKDKMNRIKGRQDWRPVAPIIAQPALSTFFDGPEESYWMTQSHVIKPEHRSSLAALSHPDNSTRGQTLREDQDPELYSWLVAMGERTGYPILVNTSFNRGGEPIVETPANAIETFLACPEIDVLILDSWWIERKDVLTALADAPVRLGDGIFLTTALNAGKRFFNVTNGSRSWPLSEASYRELARMTLEVRPLSALCGSIPGDGPYGVCYEWLQQRIVVLAQERNQ